MIGAAGTGVLDEQNMRLGGKGAFIGKSTSTRPFDELHERADVENVQDVVAALAVVWRCRLSGVVPCELHNGSTRHHTEMARRMHSTLDSSPGPASEPLEIDIRPLESLRDFRACVNLQNDVWGPAFSDGVPASLLQAATHVGGIALGASMNDGTLAGFVFGLTGVNDGEPVHWSHMLAVRQDMRDFGVGRRLKEAQRAELARSGVRTMWWTFDPLIARNAHLNFNRLGARVVKYVPNMYGDAMSPLHGTMETDRLVVSCDTDLTSIARRRDVPQALSELRTSIFAAPEIGGLSPFVYIEIPSDIQAVIAESPAAGAGWRASVREQFQTALAHAYEVMSVVRDPASCRTFYALARNDR